MSKTKKLTISGILVASGVICSTFYIPIGVAKCFPVQHFINVLAAVLLGPTYGVSMAFATSFIRVMTGTGTLLAFPGSMIGALLSGILYKYTKNTVMAFIGEVCGTGILGAIIAYPIATVLLSKDVALFGFIIPFGISTIVGSLLSLIFISAISKTGILNKLTLEEK